MKIKKFLNVFCFILVLLSCSFLCACGGNPDDDSSYDRDASPMEQSTRYIADGFECSKNKALAMEEIFDDCGIKVQKSSYVTRDETRDWDNTSAYIVKWDVTLNGKYSQERFYVYLDDDKKIVDVRIWSDYLYKNYEFVQTANQLYIKQHSSFSVTFDLVKDYSCYWGNLNQSIKYGNYATAPTFTNYNVSEKFIGWSVDGQNVVDVSTYMIKGNTTFIALWEPDTYFEVNFMLPAGATYTGELTQQVIEEGYAIEPEYDCSSIELEEGVFWAWAVDGETIVLDISTYKITQNTLFVLVEAIWE